MNADYKPKPRRRFLTVVCCCFALLPCFGCASYFRTDALSYEELKEKNQQQRQEDKMWFKPGTVFYSR